MPSHQPEWRQEFATSEFHLAFLATSSCHLATYLEGHACDLLKPVWNQPKLAGFGSRFQGAARANQRGATWSVFHPGRRCGNGSPLHSRKELREIIAEHLTTTAPQLGIALFDP